MGPAGEKCSTKVFARGVWSAGASRALLNVHKVLDTICCTQLTKKGQKAEFFWTKKGQEEADFGTSLEAILVSLCTLRAM